LHIKFEFEFEFAFRSAGVFGTWHWNFTSIFGVRKLESLVTMQHCLHYEVFRHFDRRAVCDGRTDGHRTIAYTALA